MNENPEDPKTDTTPAEPAAKKPVEKPAEGEPAAGTEA